MLLEALSCESSQDEWWVNFLIDIIVKYDKTNVLSLKNENGEIDNPRYNTPLIFAMKCGRSNNLIKKLVLSIPEKDRATSINEKDSSGYTALHYACYMGDEKLIQFLIEQGADLSIDNKGSLPLDFYYYQAPPLGNNFDYLTSGDCDVITGLYKSYYSLFYIPKFYEKNREKGIKVTMAEKLCVADRECPRGMTLTQIQSEISKNTAWTWKKCIYGYGNLPPSYSLKGKLVYFYPDGDESNGHVLGEFRESQGDISFVPEKFLYLSGLYLNGMIIVETKRGFLNRSVFSLCSGSIKALNRTNYAFTPVPPKAKEKESNKVMLPLSKVEQEPNIKIALCFLQTKQLMNDDNSAAVKSNAKHAFGIALALSSLHDNGILNSENRNIVVENAEYAQSVVGTLVLLKDKKILNRETKSIVVESAKYACEIIRTVKILLKFLNQNQGKVPLNQDHFKLVVAYVKKNDDSSPARTSNGFFRQATNDNIVEQAMNTIFDCSTYVVC
jgi:hypothetical protein